MLLFFITVIDWRVIVLNVICLIFPYIECGYVINGALQLIVPIMGRSGSGNHCELVLGLISASMFTLFLSFMVGNYNFKNFFL